MRALSHAVAITTSLSTISALANLSLFNSKIKSCTREMSDREVAQRSALILLAALNSAHRT